MQLLLDGEAQALRRKPDVSQGSKTSRKTLQSISGSYCRKLVTG
jgi:hypothetical protein